MELCPKPRSPVTRKYQLSALTVKKQTKNLLVLLPDTCALCFLFLLLIPTYKSNTQVVVSTPILVAICETPPHRLCILHVQVSYPHWWERQPDRQRASQAERGPESGQRRHRRAVRQGRRGFFSHFKNTLGWLKPPSSVLDVNVNYLYLYAISLWSVNWVIDHKTFTIVHFGIAYVPECVPVVYSAAVMC